MARYDQCGFRDVLAGALHWNISTLGCNDRFDRCEFDLVVHNLPNPVDMPAPRKGEHSKQTNDLLRTVGNTQHSMVRRAGGPGAGRSEHNH